MLPVFLLYRSYGLNDTRLGLILMYTAMTLPLSAWMMFASFRQLPSALEEAALVDGCTRWGAFWKIALRLAAPGIVAAAVFAFIFCWTEFFFALILTSRNAFTLPTVFRAFLGFQALQYGESSALAVISLVPSDRARHARAAPHRARPDPRRRPVGHAQAEWQCRPEAGRGPIGHEQKAQPKTL